MVGDIGANLPQLRVAAVLALAAILGLLASGCGGSSSGDGGTMSKEEVTARVESACLKADGYAVWLPEHLQKAGRSAAEGTAIMKRADDEFRSSLESLDPPADLAEPIEGLESTDPTESGSSLADLKASLKKQAALYDEVGADRCSKSLRASILSIDGKSVEEAFESVGLPLPQRPAGW